MQGAGRWGGGLLALALAGGGAGQVVTNRGGAEPEGEPPREVQLALMEREDMDQLLWANEVLAQDYEAVINGFWDALCRAPRGKRLGMLAGVPFRTIMPGAPGEKEALEDGVVIRRSGVGGGGPLTAMEWVERVKAFEARGMEIVQSEWRQVNFLPPLPAERGAQSVVEYEIDLAEAGGEEIRMVVTGTLRISWLLEGDGQGRPRMDAVDATECRVLERRGKPWFEEVLKLAPASAAAGEGVVLGPVLVRDLNGDGLPEVVLGGRNVVLRNKGGFRFEEERLPAGEDGRFRAGVLEDFDGDGEVDLLVVRMGGEGCLLRGAGGGRFEEGGERPWMDLAPQARAMTVGDVDGDGNPDVWVAQHTAAYTGGKLPMPYFDANDGDRSTLWINDGAGHFLDGTEAAGLAAKRQRRTNSASFVDLDRDGDVDLLVASDFAGLDAYRNDGEGKFVEATGEWFDERSGFGAALAFGNFDGDGRPDFCMAGRSSTAARRLNGLGLRRSDKEEHDLMRMPMNHGIRLYEAQGERYLQGDLGKGCAAAGWAWGAAAFDLENDGDDELYVANGGRSGRSVTDYASYFWRHDIYMEGNSFLVADRFRPEQMRGLEEGAISWSGREHNRLYLNLGGEEFREAGFLFGVGCEEDSRSVVAADLDLDGRQDLLVVTQRGRPGGGGVQDQELRIFRNVAPEAAHWLGVRLQGAAGAAVAGARVVVSGDFGTRERVLVTGDSFLAQHPAVAHFGLGAAEGAVRVEVWWPGGGKSVREGVEVDAYILMRAPVAGSR